MVRDPIENQYPVSGQLDGHVLLVSGYLALT